MLFVDTILVQYELPPIPSNVSSEEASQGAADAEDETTVMSQTLSKSATERERRTKAKARIAVEHIDIIKDDFWDRRPWILTGRPGRLPKQT